MNQSTLVNLAPALELMGAAALVALLPLAWAWRRYRGQSARQRMVLLVSVTLFLTFDLIVFGAFTRLSDSGLGCPDWPGCYGESSPFAASHPIALAQSLMPTGPVTQVKAWVEMIHRYAAMVVGFLIVVQVVSAWRWRKQDGVGVALPLLTLFWVCLQGAFGAWTVTMKLQPIIVSGHLIGGMVLAALLQWQRQRLLLPTLAVQGVPSTPAKGLVLGVMVLVVAQIALGAWVSTNYAVLACQDFPQCQSSWWPTMNFAAGFEFWRPLGLNGQGEPIVFEALVAIHYTHRLMAYLVLVAVVFLAWRLRMHTSSKPTGTLLLALALWQLLSGVSNVVFQWPLVAALAHTAGAAALVIVLTGHLVRIYSPRYSS